MNKWILAAAIICGVTFFIHVIAGGIDVHNPLLKSELSLELKAIISVLWHMISALFLINTIALYVASRSESLREGLVWLVAMQFIAMAAIFVFYSVSRLGSPFAMGQWTIILLISVLAFVGLNKSKKVGD